MNRSRRTIVLAAVWLAMFFAGPVLSALAVPCASSMPNASSASCPMEQNAGEAAAPAAEAACCCPSMSSEERGKGAALQSSESDPMAVRNACACSVKSGDPAVPGEAVQAPLPGVTAMLLDVSITAAITPLAHLAADAPLPPFAARLRLPLRSLDAGRAPPIASRQLVSSFA